MKVAHVIQSIDPGFGGPSAVVMRLAVEQSRLGAAVTIVAASSPTAQHWFDEGIRKVGSSAKVELVLWPSGWMHTLFPGSHAHELRRGHDIIHVHGVWDSLVMRCLAVRAREGARIVLAPHGMLSRWSLQQKKLKKTLAFSLWMRSALTQVDRFHALNEAESRELRELLPRSNVCVLPNGADLVELRDTPVRPRMPYILFLARLHPMKGPDRLINAFARCVQKSSLAPDIELVIAGPDFGVLDELRDLATRLGIAARVRFPGAVFGPQKESLLHHALALCQPSRHEGFSLTLLEALAHGIPVITTPDSNFPEISAADCGMVVNGDDVDALASALSRLAADPGMRARMGNAGKLLVEQHYTWPTIADRALRLYEQCCGVASEACAMAPLSAAPTGR